MRGRRGVVLVVAGFLTVSAPVHAQWWATPRIYCPIGSTACMGAYFTFTNAPPIRQGYTGTLFSAYLQNLQGTFGGRNTPTSSINGFGLRRINRPPSEAARGTDFLSDPATATPLGNVEIGHFVGTNEPWPVFKESSGGGPFPNHPVEDAAQYHWNGLTGLTGCRADYLPGDPDNPELIRVGMFHYRTCPRSGLDGWLRVDFFVDLWSYDGAYRNALLSFDDFAFDVSFDGAFVGEGDFCSFGNNGSGMPEGGTNCNVFDYRLPTVTPEPSTLILLSGTLPLALGFIRARRRRR